MIIPLHITITMFFEGMTMALINERPTRGVTAIAPSPLAEDMLNGVADISAFTGWPARRVYYIASTGQIKSIFKMGRQLCARRSTLLLEIAQREAAGGAPQNGDGE